MFSEAFQQRPLCPTRRATPRRTRCHCDNGCFVVTGMHLVRAVLTGPEHFSNAVSRRSSPPAEVVEEVAAIRAQGARSVPTLLANNPPRHTRYRRMVSRAFTPRALAWSRSWRR